MIAFRLHKNPFREDSRSHFMGRLPEFLKRVVWGKITQPGRGQSQNLNPNLPNRNPSTVSFFNSYFHPENNHSSSHVRYPAGNFQPQHLISCGRNTGSLGQLKVFRGSEHATANTFPHPSTIQSPLNFKIKSYNYLREFFFTYKFSSPWACTKVTYEYSWGFFFKSLPACFKEQRRRICLKANTLINVYR